MLLNVVRSHRLPADVTPEVSLFIAALEHRTVDILQLEMIHLHQQVLPHVVQDTTRQAGIRILNLRLSQQASVNN